MADFISRVDGMEFSKESLFSALKISRIEIISDSVVVSSIEIPIEPSL